VERAFAGHTQSRFCNHWALISIANPKEMTEIKAGMIRAGIRPSQIESLLAASRLAMQRAGLFASISESQRGNS
jgi:hypothetical protein